MDAQLYVVFGSAVILHRRKPRPVLSTRILTGIRLLTAAYDDVALTASAVPTEAIFVSDKFTQIGVDRDPVQHVVRPARFISRELKAMCASIQEALPSVWEAIDCTMGKVFQIVADLIGSSSMALHRAVEQAEYRALVDNAATM